jgi:hypothetical protein
LVTEGLDLVSEGGVGSDKRGVRGNELLEVGLLVGGSAGAVFQGIDDGVQEARVEGVGFRGWIEFVGQNFNSIYSIFINVIYWYIDKIE